MSAPSSFYPSRAIVLSEMPTREKEKYYQLLLENNCKFFEDEKGNYVGSVRLLAPGVKDKDETRSSAEAILKACQLPYEERLRLINTQGFISVSIVGAEQFDYSPYPRFVALIADNGDTVKPKSRVLSWVMKIIEDSYDTRWTSGSLEKGESTDGELAASAAAKAVGDNIHMKVFPVFVVRRLSLTMGLKKVVDQTCWDLLLNIDKYRKEYLEVEIFGRFIQEFYDHDALVFFLYVRSMVANVLHINFKTRWTRPDQANPRNTQNLWMSYRECLTVSRIVFGADKEHMTKDFMALLLPHMVGQRTETTDSRRIDITQFLHLAVVGYHQTHANSDTSGTSGTSDASATAGNAQAPNNMFSNDITPHSGMDLGGGGTDLNWQAKSATDKQHSSETQAAALVESFTALQETREKEFLDFICESLDDSLTQGRISEESASSVLNQLYYKLRVTINEAVGDVSAFGGNLDAFDDALLHILRGDELREEMENLRDSLIESEATH